MKVKLAIVTIIVITSFLSGCTDKAPKEMIFSGEDVKTKIGVPEYLSDPIDGNMMNWTTGEFINNTMPDYLSDPIHGYVIDTSNGTMPDYLSEPIDATPYLI